jgi:hypothetical protein
VAPTSAIAQRRQTARAALAVGPSAALRPAVSASHVSAVAASLMMPQDANFTAIRDSIAASRPPQIC